MPNRFTPISTKSDLNATIRQINDNFRQLDAEAYSKTIMNGGGKNAMQFGRLSNGRYGLVIYSEDGRAQILVGIAPNGGRAGIWCVKPGSDVFKEVK